MKIITTKPITVRPGETVEITEIEDDKGRKWTPVALVEPTEAHLASVLRRHRIRRVIRWAAFIAAVVALVLALGACGAAPGRGSNPAMRSEAQPADDVDYCRAKRSEWARGHNSSPYNVEARIGMVEACNGILRDHQTERLIEAIQEK